MELFRMSDLYKVRRALLEGKQTEFTLVEIDQLIVDAHSTDFISSPMREKLERVLNGPYTEAAGSRGTMH